MVTGVIYMYTSPKGKSYVGQTTDEKKRRANWFSSMYEYAGDAINRARKKYGRESFYYEVLFKYDFADKKIAQEALNILESYFILKYDTYVCGYNCSRRGENHFGYKVSKEGRENISKGVLSWIRTPEGKAKLKNRPKQEYKKGHRIKSLYKPVVQLTLDGEYVAEYPSIRDAEEAVLKDIISHTRTNICAVCNGKRDSAEGYKWLFKADYYDYFLHPNIEGIPQRVQRALSCIEKQHTPKIKKKCKRKYVKKVGPKINRFAQKVGQYRTDTLQLVKVWRCAGEAARAMGIDVACIGHATRNLGTSLGYYWRKYNGEQMCEPKSRKCPDRSYSRKQILQLDMEGNVIRAYDGIDEAVRSIGANNRTCISKALNGRAHTAYGYKWKILNCA